MKDTRQPVTITGQATCIVGGRAGHDADECRANALSNGGVLCVICGCTYPSETVKLFEAARGIDFYVSNIRNGSRITRETPPREEGGISPYAAACLSGYDPATFEITYLDLVFADGVQGQIKYTPEEAAYAAEDPTTNFGRVFEGNELSDIPASAADFARRLTGLGFRLTAAIDDDGRRTLKLMKGRGIIGSKIVEGGKPVPDPDKVCVLGISVELSF